MLKASEVLDWIKNNSIEKSIPVFKIVSNSEVLFTYRLLIESANPSIPASSPFPTQVDSKSKFDMFLDERHM